MRPGMPGTPGVNKIAGKIVQTTFVGETSEHLIDAAGVELRVTRMPPVFAASGPMIVEFLPEDAMLFASAATTSAPHREIPAHASLP